MGNESRTSERAGGEEALSCKTSVIKKAVTRGVPTPETTQPPCLTEL